MADLVSKEMRKFYHQLGALLKKERLRQGLTREVVGSKFNQKTNKNIKCIERGKSYSYKLIVKLADYYGVRFIINMEWKDENESYQRRCRQAENSSYDFCRCLGYDLKRLRENYHLSVERLSELSHLPVEEIEH